MNKLQKFIYILFSSAAVILVAFILYCTLNSKTVYTNQIFWTKAFVGIISIVFLAVFLFISHIFNKRNIEIFKSEKIYFIILTIFIILIRVAWIFMVDTAPISDFSIYHSSASRFSQGNFVMPSNYFMIFPLKTGYSLILALVYKIAGISIFAGKIFNVLLGILTAYTIYFTSKEIFGKKAAYTSGMIFTFFPTQIMFTSVLASEHIFTLFFLLSILFFIKSLKYFDMDKLKNINLVYIILTGVAAAATRFIRPVSMMLFPAFVIYILFFVLKSLKKDWKKIIFFFVVFFASYYIVFASYSAVVYNVLKVPLWKTYAGYNIAVGLNFDFNGTYNTSDANYFSQFDHDPELYHSEGKKLALERLKTHTLKDVYYLVKAKYNIVWGDNNYALKWSTEKLSSENSISRKISDYKIQILKPMQIYYILIMVLALIAIIKNLIYSKKIPVMLILLLLFAHIASYSLLEAQSRYAYPAVIMMIILSGYGFCIKEENNA